MKVYDKASWHIDNGEDKDEVLSRFSFLFAYLEKKNMLTDEGKEIFELGIDSSISLHERLVTDEGKKFLEANIDELLKMSISDVKGCLQENS